MSYTPPPPVPANWRDNPHVFNHDGTVRDHDPDDPNCPPRIYLNTCRRLLELEGDPEIRDRVRARMEAEMAMRRDRDLREAAVAARFANAYAIAAGVRLVKVIALVVGAAWLLMHC